MISRRKFLGAIGAIAGGFMILPPATTYQRVWKVTRAPIEPATEISKPIFLATPFRYWGDLTPSRPLILPGQFSDELMSTLFPLTHARSR